MKNLFTLLLFLFFTNLKITAQYPRVDIKNLKDSISKLSIALDTTITLKKNQIGVNQIFVGPIDGQDVTNNSFFQKLNLKIYSPNIEKKVLREILNYNFLIEIKNESGQDIHDEINILIVMYDTDLDETISQHETNIIGGYRTLIAKTKSANICSILLGGLNEKEWIEFSNNRKTLNAKIFLRTKQETILIKDVSIPKNLIHEK